MTDRNGTVPDYSPTPLLRTWRLSALVAVASIGLAVGRYFGVAQIIPIALGMVLLGVAFVFFEVRRSDESRMVIVAGSIVVLLFAATAIPGIDKLYWGSWDPRARVAIGVIALVGAAWRPLQSKRRQLLVGILIIWMVVLLGTMIVVRNPDSGVDVQYAHQEASSILFEGRNPYSDMVIPDTSPGDANEGTIVGYSYPPVTLVVYSIAGRLGDARLANVALIALLLTMILVQATRSFRGGVVLVGAVATLPFLGGMVIGGWTEPLQAVLLVGSAILYRRWVAASVLLGLAIASKQYMVLALVPVIVSGGHDRTRRSAVALGVAAVTYLPFFVWNPGAMWDALVGHQLQRVARTDVTSLWGLGLQLSAAGAAVIAVIGFVLVARRAHNPRPVLLAQALVLGIFFILAPNSFLNFWFLVVVLIVGAISLDLRKSEKFPEVQRTDDEVVSSGR